MPAIFISHSSVDRQVSGDVKAALDRLGFEHTFLDFDKTTGLGVGDRWEMRLYEELSRCHAVVLLLTPAWNASKWCFAELVQARALGKVILPVLCEPLGGQFVLPDIQAVDLVDWNAGGLARLEQRLRAISDELARGFTLDPRRPPYPGINAFQKEDAAIYFGRDEESRAVLEKLDARRTQGGARFVVIIGASGSGKSSLLKASVLPLLARRRTEWALLPEIRPEKAPMEALAKALAQFAGKPETWRDWHEQLTGPDAVTAIERFVQDARIGDALGATVLLPVDQFEEAFTTTPASERTAFLGLLQAAFAHGIALMVIATGRSDVLEGLIESSELVGRYETFPLTAMPLERYPRLIEGPAAVAGIIVEDGLSARIVQDIESKEALPLLAYTLALLYRRGGADNKLSNDDYNALGDPANGRNPIQNSIRFAADDAMRGVNADDRELAALRDAFVPHLVRVRPDDGKRVRQTARRTDLPQDALRLIGALTNARLLTTRTGEAGQAHETLVEVTHESLFKAWPTLDQWLTDEQAFLTDLERIRAAHENWSKAPDAQKSGELLYGLLLSRARDWLLKYPQRFISREMEPLRAFIAASAEVADAEKAREAAREAREMQMRTRQLYGAVAAAVVSIGLAGWAGWNSYAANTARAAAVASEKAATSALSEAEAARGRAEEQRNQALITQSRFLTDQARQALKNHDPGTAMALALEALPDARRKIIRPYLSAAESMLYQSVTALRDQGKLQDKGPFYSARFSPDGRRILTWSDSALQLWDAAGGRVITPVDGCVNPMFSPDGKRIVSVCADLSARISDAETGKPIRELPHDKSLQSAVFAPDGRVVTTSGYDTVRVWPAAGDAPPRVLSGGEANVKLVLFSPDHQVVTISDDDIIRTWNPDPDSTPTVLDMQAKVLTAAYTREGLRIVTGSDDNVVRISDGTKEIIALQHSKWIRDAQLSMDGRRLMTIEAGSQSLRIWDIAGNDAKVLSPDQSTSLEDQGDIDKAKLSPDGRQVLIAVREKDVRLWDVGSRRRIAEFDVPTGSMYAAEFSPDGRQVVTAADSVRIWDATDGGALRILRSHENTIHSVAFSADGQQIVTASSDSSARVWDATSGAQLAKLEHPSAVRGAAFSPDGRSVVTGGLDGILRSWDATTRAPTEALARGHGIILSVTASSDHKHVILAYQGNLVQLWDPVARAPPVELGRYPGPVRSAADARHGQRVVAVVASDVWLQNAARDAQPERLNQGGGAIIPGPALSPDGHRIAIGNADGQLAILDADSENHPELISWKAHSEKIVHAAFAPDGLRVLTTSGDNTARLWDSATGEEVAVLNGHWATVTSAAFSPDGQRIVTASDDHTARIWPAFLTTQALVDHARAVMPRQLTVRQRKDFFLDAPGSGVASGATAP